MVNRHTYLIAIMYPIHSNAPSFYHPECLFQSVFVMPCQHPHAIMHPIHYHSVQFCFSNQSNQPYFHQFIPPSSAFIAIMLSASMYSRGRTPAPLLAPETTLMSNLRTFIPSITFTNRATPPVETS